MSGARKPAGASLGAALLFGALGWSALLLLTVSRVFAGAPRDDGALALGLAIALALLLTSATLLTLRELRRGFGALDTFFHAALARSAQRREEPSAAAPREHPRRGYIGDRPYVVNSDGTVTVETLLGPRMFPSLADAQDFIGA